MKHKTLFGCLEQGDRFAFNFPRTMGGRIEFTKTEVTRNKCGTLSNAEEVDNGGASFFFQFEDSIEKL